MLDQHGFQRSQRAGLILPARFSSHKRHCAPRNFVSLFGSGGDYLPTAGGGGSSPVVWNSDGADGFATGVTTYGYTGMTVGAGANRALVILFGVNTTITGPTVIWDAVGANQSMTLIGSQQMSTWTKYVYAFGLVAPAAGNKTATISWTGACDIMSTGIDYTNANQGGGILTFSDFASTNGTSVSVAEGITGGDANSLAVAGAVWDGPGGVSSAHSHTAVYENSHSSGFTFAAQRATAGGTPINFSWTIASTQWGILGFNVRPV